MTLAIKKKKNSFGDWLREIRTGKGIGVRALASLVNGECSASYISYLERNVYSGKEGKPTRPSESIVKTLAVGLDVPLNEARLAAGYSPLPTAASEDDLIRAFPSLIAGYGMLSQKGKQILEKQVDSFVRGLMEMEGVSFSDEKLLPDLERETSGLEAEEFTIDLSLPESEPQYAEKEDKFSYMTDEELRLNGIEMPSGKSDDPEDD